MKSKSNIFSRSIKAIRKRRLKKEDIRDILLECSGKRNYPIEYLWIMSVKGNEIHGTSVIKGGLKGVHFHISDIAERLREDRANEFILVHNHPSGDPRPSEGDLNFLSYLETLESKIFKLQDFLIFSEQYIYSHEWNKNLSEGETYPIFWSEKNNRLSSL